MKLPHSNSILQLTLAAFILVTLPLAIGLIVATTSVRQLADQGQQAVHTAADTVRYSQLMVEDLTGMERSARQFSVLRDPTLYQIYLRRHRAFLKIRADFGRLNLNPDMRHQLDKLALGELSIYYNFNATAPTSATSRTALAQFVPLHRLARQILAAGTHSVGTEVHKMQTAANRLDHKLDWFVIILIPLVLLVAALAVVLISRPIHAIDDAIKRLGDGGLDRPVAIRGPRDLVELGRRLDWLRNRLNELEQHRVKFLQHISHELKTPLTAIREGTQLMTDEVTGPLNPEQREVADILHASGLQLQKRIEDLLNFSSLEDAGSGTPQPVQLDHVVARVVGEQRVAIKARQLAVVPDLEPATVVGDPERIRLVVENLFMNAVKYSPERGTIRFHLRRRENMIVLDVEDQGPGVALAEREKVFEAFYQGRPPENAGHVKGTGLGLAIAREYLRACQGTIEIIDAAAGAHFRVTLPVA
ncbi:MAG TPA: HAMP domain-containing sensor histidine kinase [Gammaproteobacteria bacterium]|nr:HAMP domain-containing sensor histidine kinase [Gammaproteobacteria bacterium]